LGVHQITESNVFKSGVGRMTPRTGTPITSHGFLDGVIRPRKPFGCFVGAHSKPKIKLRLQNSRNRKAPITLPNIPFDHRGDKS
jgi:hypothetical protein